MRIRPLRACLVAALTTTAIVIPAAPAPAILDLADSGQLVTSLGSTGGGLLPVGGGLVTGATGAVGGIVTGATTTVGSTVDQVVGGLVGGDSSGGLLPGSTLDDLLATLGLGSAGGASGGTTGAQGAGGLVLDARAPNAKFKVLSRLSRVGKTGKLRVRVTTDEAGIVAFSGSVKPGRTRKTSRKARRAAAAKAIKFPTAVLAFRSPGSLNVTIALSRRAQRALNRVRDATLSLGVLTADLARNQAKSTVRKKINR